MLVISRKKNDAFVIFNDGVIVVTVVQVKPNQTRFAISARYATPVHRLEVYEAAGFRHPARDGEKKREDHEICTLVLARRKGEGIVINDCITLTVVEIRRNQVRVGITAPREVRIVKKEIYDKCKDPPPTKDGAPSQAKIDSLESTG